MFLCLRSSTSSILVYTAKSLVRTASLNKVHLMAHIFREGFDMKGVNLFWFIVLMPYFIVDLAVRKIKDLMNLKISKL